MGFMSFLFYTHLIIITPEYTLIMMITMVSSPACSPAALLSPPYEFVIQNACPLLRTADQEPLRGFFGVMGHSTLCLHSANAMRGM